MKTNISFRLAAGLARLGAIGSATSAYRGFQAKSSAGRKPGG
jgi:hypothetical protein